MIKLYNDYSQNIAKKITESYSTSFSSAVKLLSRSIRQDVYNIYGFVRIADEIVDTFVDYPNEELFQSFEKEYRYALNIGLSTNPLINAFVQTQLKYAIPQDLVDAFLDSMKADLVKKKYETEEEMNQYIYGSADVVGLMCLKVFVNGDEKKYQELKYPAMKLGSAFQKVNFLRDLKADFEILDRVYFPNVDFYNFSSSDKDSIIRDIKADFAEAYDGIKKIPMEARLGVYTAYRYYLKLLQKIEKTPSKSILNRRIRVSDPMKLAILGSSYIRKQFNLL